MWKTEVVLKEVWTEQKSLNLCQDTNQGKKMTITFNKEPWYDDFDPTKNYHRILFKPGFAVQARELTQSTRNKTSGYFFITSAIPWIGFMMPTDVSL